MRRRKRSSPSGREGSSAFASDMNFEYANGKGRGGGGRGNRRFTQFSAQFLISNALLLVLLSAFSTTHAQSVPALPTFSVRATPTRLTTSTPANATLLCHAQGAAPILCLWRTPYGHVYTLSEGVFAEGGRLRHLRPRAGAQGCGLEIRGVESRDGGEWECEVGAVVGEDFMTRTDAIVLDVKTATRRAAIISNSDRSGSNSNDKGNVNLSGTGGISVNTDGRSGLIRSRAKSSSAGSSRSATAAAVQEVGDDVILNCAADRKVDLCRWKTPYLNTYIVGEGIYVERGRIAWKGQDPRYDCTIQVSNLELRDGGVWVCEIGSNVEDDFQVQTKEFQIEIETPLKLSAPTSLMQNANTDAMLVCHANKPFDRCLWTTPYGVTYAFPTRETRHEDGRIAFFGFSDNDCGVVVHQVGPDDNGGWTCQLHTTSGDIFQNATDVVPLFTDSDVVRGSLSAQPRAIEDYDYDEANSRLNNHRLKPSNDRDSSSGGGIRGRDYFPVEPTAQDSQRKPVSVQVIGIDDTFKEVPGLVRDFKRIGVASSSSSSSSEEYDGGEADVEITRISKPSSSSSSSSSGTRSRTGLPPRSRIRGGSSSNNSKDSPAISIFKPGGRDRGSGISDVDPIELELLSRISGTRRGGEARPMQISQKDGDESSSEEEDAKDVVRTTESSRRTTTTSDRRIRIRLKEQQSLERTNTISSSTTPNSERMRQLEVQRLRDERRKKAQEKAEKELREKESRDRERKRKEEEKERERIRLKELDIERRRKEAMEREERRRKEAEDKRKKELEQRRREEEEQKRKEEAEKEAKRKREREERRRKEAEEKRRKELEDKRRREQEEKRKREYEERRRREEEEKRRRDQLIKEAEEREAKRRREIEALRRKQLEEQRAREAEERRQKQIEEERKRKQEEEKKKKEEEEERQRRREEARKRKEEEERKKKEAEERRQRRREEERKRKEEEDRKRKEQEERRQRRREEERKRKEEAERKRKAEAERKRKEEEERKKKEEEELRQRRREEERKRKEEEERQKKLAEERRLKRLEEERKKKQEEERQRKLDEEERQKKLEEEERQKKLDEERRQRIIEEERQKLIEEEEKKKEEEERQRKEEEEKARIDEERKRKAAERRRSEERRRIREQLKREREEQEKKEREERFRKNQEQIQRQFEDRTIPVVNREKISQNSRRFNDSDRKEEIDRLRKEEEERAREEAEKKRQMERQRQAEEEKKRKEEQRRKEEQIRRIAEDQRRKEEAERSRRLEAQRLREELEKKRRDEALRKQREEEEIQRRLEEERKKNLERQRKEEEEKSRRDEEVRKSLERIREEKRQKELAEKREHDRLLEQRRQREEEARKHEEERRQSVERERQKQRELQEEIEKRREEERRQREREEREREEQVERRKKLREQRLQEQQQDDSSQQAVPRFLQDSGSSKANSNIKPIDVSEEDRKKCTMSSETPNGNITCGSLRPDAITAEFHVPSGGVCTLECQRGYVSLDARENHCVNGLWTIGRIFACVRPDALILVGGRSDTYGVLSSVELVTGRGVCRGAVPDLPAMRWRMVTATIARDKVLSCGGVNIFGDPKTDCWTLGFAAGSSAAASWRKTASMGTARDAAAWAFESGFLVVLGGSLGKLSGYTDSVEMYNAATGNWIEGPKMSSSRYSHCAVPLGNGSIIVTGGYGGLETSERLDLDSGSWSPLPELNPIRAQHGCALVNVGGEEGVIVVGGDSGGTRLKDVRFLSLSDPREWRRMPDLNTARWGRPAVGVVGGRVTVAAGWDGTRDLDTVEWYDERENRWRQTSSRLQTERRWPAASPISLSLFPKCAQKRIGR